MTKVAKILAALLLCSCTNEAIGTIVEVYDEERWGDVDGTTVLMCSNGARVWLPRTRGDGPKMTDLPSAARNEV